MSRAIKRADVMIPELELGLSEKIKSWLPVIAPIVIAIAFILIRLEFGERGFLSGRALTMLALISYMSAAVLLVTNLFVKEKILSQLGLFTAAMGYCFGLSGWMIRWIEAGEHEGWIDGRVWRYYPLDNLYALTLGFVSGAALATLIVIRKPKYRNVGALSMPILVVVLTLGILLGDQINTLQPVLDSYWRPIHVSIATVGYGVCLLSFGVAFGFLLKDGIRSEAVAIAVLLFGVLVYVTVGEFGIPFHGEYGSSLMRGAQSFPVRAILPGVGPLMIGVFLLILVSLALFIVEHRKRDSNAAKWAWRSFGAAAVLQGVVVAAVFYSISRVDNPTQAIPDWSYNTFGVWLVEQMEGNAPPGQPDQIGRAWVKQNAAGLNLSPKGNPVEVGALVGLFVALLMGWLISRKRSVVDSALPSIQTLDSLLYRSVSVAFPLLSLLLITGAVWANESWGRYWGWDSKEVGALVSWMAYAGYLHTRIAHGWRGRRSAFFALLGFVLVIFTWLGVSYLLPGLHSYAQ